MDNKIENIHRQESLQIVTRKLVLFTGFILIVLALILYRSGDDTLDSDNNNITQSQVVSKDKKHTHLLLLVFTAGLLGGFVSIQQRLPTIKDEELKTLSTSWFSITLIPINGGIFSLVLLLMFAGNILQGDLFPAYPDAPQFAINNYDSFRMWLISAYPTHGEEVAKLLFWSFVAGFSERFVPQIISSKANGIGKNQ